MEIDWNLVVSVVVGMFAYNIIFKAIGATFMKYFFKTAAGKGILEGIGDHVKK